MLRVLQSTNQTCLAINQVIADCEKVLQKAETSSTICKKKLYTCCVFNRLKAGSL